MVRLERTRRGKTPIDVTITRQNDLPRVRLTMGNERGKFTNTDMDEQEVRDLLVLLEFKLLEMKGDV